MVAGAVMSKEQPSRDGKIKNGKTHLVSSVTCSLLFVKQSRFHYWTQVSCSVHFSIVLPRGRSWLRGAFRKNSGRLKYSWISVFVVVKSSRLLLATKTFLVSRCYSSKRSTSTYSANARSYFHCNLAITTGTVIIFKNRIVTVCIIWSTFESAGQNVDVH